MRANFSDHLNSSFPAALPPQAVGALPPQAKAAGEDLDYWLAQWWTELAHLPAGENFAQDETGAYAETGDLGRVFMLGGMTESGEVERTFSVDAGDFILVPVINFFDVESPDFPWTTVTDLASATTLINDLLDEWIASIDWSSLYLTVDGRPVEDLESYLVRTEDIFTMGTVEEGTYINELGAPVGADLTWAGAAGVMVMLRPLPPGEHVISFGGSAGSFDVQVTDYIWVS